MLIGMVMASVASIVGLSGPASSAGPPQDYSLTSSTQIYLGDVTSTPAAQTMVQQHIESTGLCEPTSAFKVFNLTLAGNALPENGVSDHMVMHKDWVPLSASRVTATGGANYNVSIRPSGGAPMLDDGCGSSGPGDAPGGTGWVYQGRACPVRIDNSRGWLDHCFWYHKLAGDENPNEEYWAFSGKNTFKSKGIWWMDDAWWGVTRSPGHENMLNWWGADPDSTLSSTPCTDITLGVSVPIGPAEPTLNFDWQKCERIIPNQNAQTGAYRVNWDGLTRDTRTLKGILVTGVVQQIPDWVPSWDLNVGFKAD